jgi:endoglucanase
MIKAVLSERMMRCSKFLFVFVILIGSRSIDAGVANGPMRGWTPLQYVNDMFLGWNLGNTFDSPGVETGWGNPVTTQAMIDAVHKQGFKFMRLPVTWKAHFGGSPDYTIDASFLARVVAVANYALNDSMYVMVNTHHDGTSGGWYNLAVTGTQVTTTAAQVAAIWTQIANAFKNYGDYVVFEIFNEPQNGAPNMYGGGDAASRANLAAYQTAAVNAIRATGGNNATRMIVLQGISASPLAVSVATIPMVDANIIVSLHTYDPNGFSMNCSPSTWGSASDSSSIRNNLASEQAMVVSKHGTAIVGEWGSENCDDLASRVKHAYYYAQQCRNHLMCPVWWDDGASFHLLNRKTNPPTWDFPTIAQALVDGARSGVFPVAVSPSVEKRKSLNPGPSVKAGSIHYTLPAAAFVTLAVYTTQGRKTATLVESAQAAGKHEVKLRTNGLSSGNYILEFRDGNNFVTLPLALVR